MAELVPVKMGDAAPVATENWMAGDVSAAPESMFFSSAGTELDGGAQSMEQAETRLGEGCCIGAVIGLTAGTLLAIKAAMNTYLVIPAFGFVMPGPIGAAFGGALAGAVAGAVIGMLADRSLR